MQLPLRLQAGRLFSLRLVQLPAAQRIHTACPAGSSDSGWRVQANACEHSHALHQLNALWQRLARATHTPRMLADLRIIRHLLPTDGSFTTSPLPRRWCGRDVRPWLGDAEAYQRLLHQLEPHQREATSLLTAEFPDLPILGANHPASAASAHLWLPWLQKKRQEWNPALETATAILNKGHEADRDALVAAVLNEGQTTWLSLLVRQPAARHLPLLRALVETKQHLQLPPAGMHRLLNTLHHLSQKAEYTRAAKNCFLSLANGCTPRFLAHALRYHKQWKLEFKTQACPMHEPRARQLHLVLHCKAGQWLRQPRQIWQQATGLKDWSSVIQRLLSRPLDKETLENLLYCLRKLERKRGKDACRWTNWLARWDDMLHELHSTPRAKRTFACYLIEAWRIDPQHTAMCGHSVSQLLRWLQRAREFEKSPGEDVPSVIEAVWASIDEAEEQDLLHVPEQAWRQMRSTLAGWSARTNAIDGLSRAGKLPVGCQTGMLKAGPLTWARTMRRIGELNSREQNQLWEAFREHPLTTCDAATTPLPHVIVLVDAIHTSHPEFPGVPEKLRTADKLAAHVQEHYMNELMANIHRLRLAVLDSLAEWALRRRFPSLTGGHADTHTLRVAAAAGEENRRTFRRLLQACDRQQATREWTLSHPANQQWLKKLPDSLVEQWGGGFFIQQEVSGIGPVCLGPEDDLQAILRMGTDFGTCLSAGSFNSFSTAANALDANKRVIYARDVQGRVWARQLLAISEDRHLVCFPVYARRSHAAMRHVFATYDHTLSHALRLPLWRAREDTAPIARLVCKEWYDDGIWRP